MTALDLKSMCLMNIDKCNVVKTNKSRMIKPSLALVYF